MDKLQVTVTDTRDDPREPLMQAKMDAYTAWMDTPLGHPMAPARKRTYRAAVDRLARYDGDRFATGRILPAPWQSPEPTQLAPRQPTPSPTPCQPN